MKISTLAASPIAFCHLRNPKDGQFMYDDEKRTKKVGVNVYHPGSDRAVELVSRVEDRMIERVREKGSQDKSIAERRMETADDLAAVTASFEYFGNPDDDHAGTDNPDHIRAVYAEEGFGWLVQQVNKFRADWGNFMTGSAAS
jgi:hypothetical protein